MLELAAGELAHYRITLVGVQWIAAGGEMPVDDPNVDPGDGTFHLWKRRTVLMRVP